MLNNILKWLFNMRTYVFLIILFSSSTSTILLGMIPAVKEKLGLFDQRNKCYDFLLSDEFLLESKKASSTHEHIALCSTKLLKQKNYEYIKQQAQTMNLNERASFYRRFAIGISLAQGFYGYDPLLSGRLAEILELLSQDEALIISNEINNIQKLFLKNTQEKNLALRDLSEKCVLFLRNSAIGQEYKKNILLELTEPQLFKYLKSLALQKNNLKIAELLFVIYDINEQFSESLRLRLQLKDYQGIAKLCSNLKFKNPYEELLEIIHNSKDQSAFSKFLFNYEPFMVRIKKDKARNSDKALMAAHIYAHILASDLEKNAKDFWETCDNKSLLSPSCFAEWQNKALWYMAKNPETALMALDALSECFLKSISGRELLANLRKEILVQDLLPYVLIKRLETLISYVFTLPPKEQNLKQIETNEISQILTEKAKEILSKKSTDLTDQSFLASFCLYKLALNLGKEDKRNAESIKKYVSQAMALNLSEENRQKLKLAQFGLNYLCDKNSIFAWSLEDRLKTCEFIKEVYLRKCGFASEIAEDLMRKMAMNEDMIAMALLTVMIHTGPNDPIAQSWYLGQRSKPDVAIDIAIKILEDAGLYQLIKKEAFDEKQVCASTTRMFLILYHRVFAELNKNNLAEAKTLISQALTLAQGIIRTELEYVSAEADAEMRFRMKQLGEALFIIAPPTGP